MALDACIRIIAFLHLRQRETWPTPADRTEQLQLAQAKQTSLHFSVRLLRLLFLRHLWLHGKKVLSYARCKDRKYRFNELSGEIWTKKQNTVNVENRQCAIYQQSFCLFWLLDLFFLTKIISYIFYRFPFKSNVEKMTAVVGVIKDFRFAHLTNSKLEACWEEWARSTELLWIKPELCLKIKWK